MKNLQFLNKKVHTLRNVRFDEKENYYEIDSLSSQCIIKESKEEKEIKQIWTELENEKMNKAQRLLIASENKYFTLLNIKDFVDIDEKKNLKTLMSVN